MTPHHLIALAQMRLSLGPEHSIPERSIPSSTAESLVNRRYAVRKGDSLHLTIRGQAILARALRSDHLC